MEALGSRYLSGVMRLADSGTGVATHPLLGPDGQLGPNARIGELLREFLGAPEGEIQMMRISMDPEDPRTPAVEDSLEVSAAAAAEKARKDREKQLKKAEAAELERQQREIARREMAEGDLRTHRAHSHAGSGSAASAATSAAGGSQLTPQEIAAAEAAERRRAKKAAKARENMPPPAGSPWEVHEHEGRKYWWNRGEFFTLQPACCLLPSSTRHTHTPVLSAARSVRECTFASGGVRY